MYFEQFVNERNIKKSTMKGYQTTINKYTSFFEMSLEELIDEAINEEDNPEIKSRQRKLKRRLLQFRTSLLKDTDLEVSTIKNHMTKIGTIYKYFEVTVPELPFIKDNSVELTYLDLPTREHIKKAFKIAGIQLGSLILFMSSSGSGRSECSRLRVCDVIDSVEGYYTKTSLIDILEELRDSCEDIVPTFKMVRVKTGKSYYTFCTPECLRSIVDWLLLKNELLEDDGKKLDWNDSVWGWDTRQISTQFQNINDYFNWGYKKKYRFFRPHSLRKFHASNIGLSQENVDFLQGRSKDKLHATYIKANPSKLKSLYMDVMDNVTIKDLDKHEVIHEEFTININLNFFGNEYSNVVL